MQELECELKQGSTLHRCEHAISAPPTVLDPCDLGRSFHSILDPLWGPLLDVEVKELKRHSANRWAAEITVLTTTGKQVLIGKFYRQDRADVYLTMQKISESGLGPLEKFSIPQPLAFIQERRLLLQEKVEGSLATESFLSHNEFTQTKAAESCGRWLAFFHARGPILGRRSTLGLDWARRVAKRVGPLPEALSGKAILLSKRLEQVVPPNGKVCACHGSFSHQQVIFSEDRTIVFDWDKYCVSDPGSDVANFIVGLKQLALSSQGSINALDAPIEIFLRTYSVAGEHDLKKQLPFYMAGQCLRRARRHTKYGLKKAEAMLDEGLRILAEEL